MLLEIITPETKVFEGEVKSVKLPGIDGKFEILNNHAPIISTLSAGQIRIVDNNDERKFFNINGGVIEMQNNNIIVLAD